MKMTPFVSIIITNYNSGKLLDNCLQSVRKTTYPNKEIIVVDNGSTDGSFKNIDRTETDTSWGSGLNFGPSHARNWGIKLSKGKYFAFLDGDAEVTPGWLEPLVDMMENDPTIGACQPKIMLMDNKDRFDYVGDYLSPWGFLIQPISTGEKDIGQLREVNTVIFACKAAVMMVSREAIDSIGNFNEDYFIYAEETDLCWRIWLAGMKVMFCPNSVTYHHCGGSQQKTSDQQNYLAKFHGCKNYIFMLMTDLGWVNFFKIVPIHIFIWFGIAIWLAIKGQPKGSKYILQGIWWVFTHLKLIMERRKVIQTTRVISDKELMKVIMKKASFKYFYDKLMDKRQIGSMRGFVQ